MKARLRIHLNRILGAARSQVKALSSDAESGNANLPIGGLRHAIQENGGPGKI
jgi:hypothetical protein